MHLLQKEFIIISDSSTFTEKFQLKTKLIIKKYLLAFLIIIYCLGWYLPQCCTTKIESPILNTYGNINWAITKIMN